MYNLQLFAKGGSEVHNKDAYNHFLIICQLEIKGQSWFQPVQYSQAASSEKFILI